MENKEQLLKAEQVAGLLNVAVSTVYSFAHRGLLPSVPLGRSIRFRAASIQKLLDLKERIGFAKVA